MRFHPARGRGVSLRDLGRGAACRRRHTRDDDGSILGSVPERFLSGPWRGGSATPMEMMYLSASSTVMSSSIASERGTTRKKPAVMLGVVGTKTETWSA